MFANELAEALQSCGVTVKLSPDDLKIYRYIKLVKLVDIYIKQRELDFLIGPFCGNCLFLYTTFSPIMVE